MNENKFLEELQKRASQQMSLEKYIYFPVLFGITSKLLGNHPWRLLIPFSFLLSFFLYLSVGQSYVTFILKIFGGFHS